jgi:hypothetical protein
MQGRDVLLKVPHDQVPALLKMAREQAMEARSASEGGVRADPPAGRFKVPSALDKAWEGFRQAAAAAEAMRGPS